MYSFGAGKRVPRTPTKLVRPVDARKGVFILHIKEPGSERFNTFSKVPQL